MISPEILAKAISWRRELHRNPEPSGKEFRTCRFIREILAGFPNLKVLPPFLETDTVAILTGDRPGPNVTLRADIDALCVDEETGLSYCSANPGVMHACGHDAHAAMLLGACRILCEEGTHFAGSVRFVWQPGEESIHLGEKLLAAEALENPRAEAVTALHGQPGSPCGIFCCKSGAIMSGCAHFSITINGKGGHSSRPHLAVDPVVCAAALIQELQTIVSRRLNPSKTAVVSVCSIHGGRQSNVIPDSVTMTGTARTLHPEVEIQLEKEIRFLTQSVSAAHRCSMELTYDRGYPVTENNSELTAFARSVVEQGFGKNAYMEMEQSSMEAEDFSYYARRYPAVYMKLGTGENSPPLHSSRFVFPDEALTRGIEYFVRFVQDYRKK